MFCLKQIIKSGEHVAKTEKTKQEHTTLSENVKMKYKNPKNNNKINLAKMLKFHMTQCLFTLVLYLYDIHPDIIL